MCLHGIGNKVYGWGQAAATQAGNWINSKVQEKCPTLHGFVSKAYNDSADLEANENSGLTKAIARIGGRAGRVTAGIIGGAVGGIFKALPDYCGASTTDAAKEGEAKGSSLATALLVGVPALAVYLMGTGEGKFTNYISATGVFALLGTFFFGSYASNCLKGTGGLIGSAGVGSWAALKGAVEGFTTSAKTAGTWGSKAGTFLSLLGSRAGSALAEKIMSRISPCCGLLNPLAKTVASVALPALAALSAEAAIPLFSVGLPGMLAGAAIVELGDKIGRYIFNVPVNAVDDENGDKYKAGRNIRITSYVISSLLFHYGVLGSGVTGSSISAITKAAFGSVELLTWESGILPRSLGSLVYNILKFSVTKGVDFASEYPKAAVVASIGLAGLIKPLFSAPQPAAAGGNP